MREIGDRHPGEHRERGARADAGNPDQLAERRAFFERREAVEHLRVLAHAVAAQEAGRLVKVPGIGKKTAERLLLELKGRLAEPLPGAGGIAPAGGDAADILNALVALGYSEKEAAAVIKRLAPGLGVTEGIRAALKALAKS